MTIDAIAGLLESWELPRVSSDVTVYDLHKHSRIPWVGARLLHERQLQILRLIRALPGTVFLQYEERPDDWELPGRWRQHGQHTWEMPREETGSSLLAGYLHQGAWSLYLAEQALAGSQIPDLFGMMPGQVSVFMNGHGIAVFVQAYFDNSNWRIALQPAIGSMIHRV